MKRLISLLFGVIFLWGCSNNPPQIKQVWWLPVLVIDSTGEKVHKELILYVHGQDNEGEADLAELRLESREREVLWKIDSLHWTQWETPGEKWVGSSRIKGGAEDLTTGEYTLVLEDKGGRTAEMVLFLEGWPDKNIDRDQRIFSTAENIWQIESDYQNWMILNSSNELIPCPVNTPFNPQSMAGEGSYFYILFNRESMWQIRRGPY